MTLANRAIGAPINIWNDHSDAMSQRDCGWIQLYAESNQAAIDLHVQAFKLAEELSLPVMVCMDGFVLTHAVESLDLPSQEQVDAFLPGLPAAPGARPRRADHDRRDGRARRRSPRCATSRTRSRCTRSISSPRSRPSSPGSFGRPSGGLLRRYRTEGADTIVVALGSVLGTIEDVVDELRDEGVRIGALGITCFRPFPLEEIREALRHAARVVLIERAFAVGMGGIVGQNVRLALSGHPPVVYDVVAGLGGRADHHALAASPGRGRARGPDRAVTACSSSTWTGSSWSASCRGSRRSGAPARMRRTSCGTSASSPGGRTDVAPPVKFFQVGSFAAGNRLLDEDERSVQADRARSNALTKGHRACQGCGEALGARYVLDAAMRATEGRLIAANATGCLEVFSTPYPESSWQLPWIHSLFGNAPAVAAGVAAALKAKGRTDVRVIGQGGDGGTLDIGFACLSGMFERGDDVLYVCYDNEAYMNTGVQRSGATPPAARTATTKPVGDEPGNAFGQGKNAPLIAMAHEIPYVATATVAELHDLEAKVERAMEFHGPRYLHVFVPCPLGWGAASKDTIRIARLAKETGLFPVFEAEHGEVVGVSKIRRQVPVEEYLRLQRRFAHLFGDPPRTDVIEKLQAIADRNIRRFGLLEEVPVA